MLNAAANLDDLRAPPGNRLEALKGDLGGFHSIRINAQWRIVFRWTPGGPADVQIVDYHEPEEGAVMIPKHRIPVHPGQILLEEFLTPLAISQTQLALHLEIPVQRINELVNGKRGVTPDTAWMLAAAFATSPDFWMNLQAQHDLAKHRPTSVLAAIRAPDRGLRRRSRRANAPGRGKSSSRRAS